MVTLRSLILGGSALLASAAIAQTGPSIGADWKDPRIAEARVQAAIAHQNRLRASASETVSQVRGKKLELPRLKLLFKADDYAAPFRTGVGDPPRFWIEQGFPEMGSSAYFTLDGDRMIKSDYNDVWSLNYVYTFEDRRLLRAESLAEWKIAAEPAEEITLFRQTSPDELERWREGKLRDLGARHWGFGEADGQAHAVLHFATSPWNGKYDVKITVSKADLLELARRRPTVVWVGALDNDGNAVIFREFKIFEIVLATEALARLHARGAIKIEFFKEAHGPI